MVARKTSDTPTRIYSYRCLPPITEQQRVEHQFRIAHQYRNALVELEHRVRRKIREAQLAHGVDDEHPSGEGGVGWPLRHFEDCSAFVDAVYDDIRAAKAGTKEPDLTVPRMELEHAKELRRFAIEDLKAAKKTFAEDLKPQYEEIRLWAREERKRIRGDFSQRGLRHGTYTRIENAIDQAAKSTKKPLTFESYDKSGSIGTQLTQGDDVMGLTVSELHSCQDTRVRVEPLPADYLQRNRNQRRHAHRRMMWLRIGSNPDRSPIFAQFPITFHRPLPKDAVIKWAYVVRRPIGPHLEWRFQLTIESETFRVPTQPVGEGTVAIDLGWRRLFDDEGCHVGLRAGYTVDDQGYEREILVPQKVIERMPKVSDLAAIRDKNLEKFQFELSNWMVGRDMSGWDLVEKDQDGKDMPSMNDRLRGYTHWRSARKLHYFIDLWAKRRLAGDDEMYEHARAWAKQDRHLHAWQEHQRDRLIAHRRETWRVIASQLAKTYATIILEDGGAKDGLINLTEIPGWEQAAPDDGDPSEGREQRKMARLAAVGELRDAIVKAAAKNGAKIVPVSGVYSTRQCALCQHVNTFDARSQIVQTCAGCGKRWDQDANACRNLLARHGGVPLPPKSAPPTDGSDRDHHKTDHAEMSAGSTHDPDKASNTIKSAPPTDGGDDARDDDKEEAGSTRAAGWMAATQPPG